MPDGYVLPLGFCGDGIQCLLLQANVLKYHKAAYNKDNDAQRNVSYCIYSGCRNAIGKNPVLGCAWRIVILASGSSRESDTVFLKLCIDQIGAPGMAAARAQAATLFRTIYKREIPAEWQ